MFESDDPRLVRMAADVMRGLKRRNFWIMEETAGPGGWGSFGRNPWPGEIRKVAFQQVARGEGSLHPSVTRQVLAQMQAPAGHPPEEELTEREREVLQHMARGYSNAEIAKLMVVSQATVHTHVSRILAKLNLASRTQAALYALKKGLVSLDEVNG